MASSLSIIGLGAMGSSLARTYLSSSTPLNLTLFNRTASKAAPFLSQNSILASTAAEAIAASDLTITCLLSNAVVTSMLQTLQPTDCTGKVLVNLTNGTPEQARALSAIAKELGFKAYIHGGIMVPPNLVGQKEAVVLYSGDKEALDEHQETLKIIGIPIFMGPDAGCASIYDNALLSGMYGLLGGFLHSAALVTAVRKSQGEGIGVKDFTERLLIPLLQGILGMLPKIAGQMEDGDYVSGEDGSPLGMQLVALDNIVETSRGLGVRAQLLEEMHRLVRERVEGTPGGEGEEFGALVEGMFEDGHGASSMSQRK